MSNVVQIADQQSLQLEAATWVSKLDGKRLNKGDFQRFQTWIAASEAHETAFEEAAAMWGNLELLSELREQARLPQKLSLGNRILSGLQTVIPQPRLAFAAAVMLAVIGAVALTPGGQITSKQPVIYTTSVGEHREVLLSDGSKLLLNTASQVDVQYTAGKRTLKLIKGEAHFDVAHNPARPFEVHAGTNIVRAVGTAFTVELKTESVEVTVTEGKVELATLAHATTDESAPQETSLALITSGQSAEFSDFLKSINTIPQEEVDRKLSWHHGSLIFKGEKLEDVIEEVSRYTKTRIIISDPELRDLKVGGYFKAGETEAMLQALEANFGVSVNRVSSDLVYLSHS